MKIKMKKIVSNIIIAWLFILSCSSNGTIINPEQKHIVDTVLLYMQQEKFDKVVSYFDESIKIQLNKEKLASVWAQLQVQVGKYEKSEFFKSQKIDKIGTKVIYKSYFGSTKLNFEVIFGKENKIIGMFYKP
jgi:hypothetical protein